MKTLVGSQAELIKSATINVITLVTIEQWTDRTAGTVDRTVYISDRDFYYDYDGTLRHFQPFLNDPGVYSRDIPHLTFAHSGEDLYGDDHRFTLLNGLWPESANPDKSFIEFLQEKDFAGAQVTISELLMPVNFDGNNGADDLAGEEQTVIYRGIISSVDSITDSRIDVSCEAELPIIDNLFLTGDQFNLDSLSDYSMSNRPVPVCYGFIRNFELYGLQIPISTRSLLNLGPSATTITFGSRNSAHQHYIQFHSIPGDPQTIETATHDDSVAYFLQGNEIITVTETVRWQPFPDLSFQEGTGTVVRGVSSVAQDTKIGDISAFLTNTNQANPNGSGISHARWVWIASRYPSGQIGGANADDVRESGPWIEGKSEGLRVPLLSAVGTLLWEERSEFQDQSTVGDERTWLEEVIPFSYSSLFLTADNSWKIEFRYMALTVSASALTADQRKLYTGALSEGRMFADINGVDFSAAVAEGNNDFVANYSSLEQPGILARFFLQERCGVPATSIDKTSFDDAAPNYADLGTDDTDHLIGGVEEELGLTFQTFMARFCFEAYCQIVQQHRQDAGKFFWHIAEDDSTSGIDGDTFEYPASTATITEWDTITERSKTSDDIPTRWNFHYVPRESQIPGEFLVNPSGVTRLSLSSRAIVSGVSADDLIIDTTDPEKKYGIRYAPDQYVIGIEDSNETFAKTNSLRRVSRYYVRETVRDAAIIDVSGVPWYEGYTIEVFDIVSIQAPWWSAARSMRVLGVTHDFKNALLSFTLVEVNTV